MPSRSRALAALLAIALAAGCAGPLAPARPAVIEAPLPATAPVQPTVAFPSPVTLDDSLLLATWEVAADRTALVPVHPLTGKPLAGYTPIDLGQNAPWALAPGGRILAAIVYPDEHSEDGGQLHLIDLAAWHDQDTGATIDGYPGFFQFTPDGQSLLLAETGERLNTLSRFEARTGQRAAQVDLGFFPTQVAVTPDGAGVMVYGVSSQFGNGIDPTSHVALLDAAGLSVRWQQTLPAVLDGQYLPEGAANLHADSIWYLPATAWAPGQAVLYVVHADEDRLTTVDFAARSVLSQPIAPPQSWLDRLLALTAEVAEAKLLNGTQKQALISPAGDRLYVLGVTTALTEAGFAEIPLGLSVIDPATGHLLAQVETEARSFSLSADGQVLFLETWGERDYTEVRRTLDPDVVVRTLPNVRILAGRLRGGQPLLLAIQDRPTQTSFQVLDPATFDALGAWSIADYAAPILLPGP